MYSIWAEGVKKMSGRGTGIQYREPGGETVQ